MSAEFYQAERLVEPILAADRTYDYAQTPANFYALPEADRTTTNCKDVGHQAVAALFGIELPRQLQIVEACQNPDTARPLFRRAKQTEDLRVGDWIMFGRRDALQPRAFTPEYDAAGNLTNWCSFPVNHLGVFLGEHRGQRMILHATPGVGADITTIREIQRASRTVVVHEVLRLQ